MEGLLGFFAGLGLAAACGLRVFLPLLIMGLGTKTEMIILSPGYEWIGSDIALTALFIATVIEIGAYYIPWLDNLLDTIAMPAAFIAGTLAMSSAVADWHPFLAWTIAIIAGGGVAAVIQGGTTFIRGSSTLATGGLANPIVSTAETVSGGFIAFLALLTPIVAAVLSIAAVALSVKFILGFLGRRKEGTEGRYAEARMRQ